MGFWVETRVARVGGHTVEVRGRNHPLRGLLYELLVDGRPVAAAQNFWKVPTTRRLDATVRIGGADRRVVVSVTQRWLATDYVLTVDGEPVPLAPAG